jgi:sporulation protein YlmC with PRC-barrel domain
MRLAFFLGTWVLLLTAMPALGQDTNRRQSGSEPRRASDLLDATVTQSGRILGRVRDVTLNDSGRVQDLIVRTDRGLVVVPFSAATYNRDEGAYAIAARITPRPIGEARNADDQRQVSPGERFARAGRLVRNGSPPPARLEREPELRTEVSPEFRDGFVEAARIYSEPSFSVSVTRNIDRLPRRSVYQYDNYTLPSEAEGKRSFNKLPPPPALAR